MSEQIILDIKAEILRVLNKTLTECEKIMAEHGCDLHEAVRIKLEGDTTAKSKVIHCNGMPIPMICKKCQYGKVTEEPLEITCSAPDIDGVPVVGIEKSPRCQECGYVDYSTMYASDPPQYKCERYGHLVRITDKCKEKG